MLMLQLIHRLLRALVLHEALLLLLWLLLGMILLLRELSMHATLPHHALLSHEISSLYWTPHLLNASCHCVAIIPREVLLLISTVAVHRAILADGCSESLPPTWLKTLYLSPPTSKSADFWINGKRKTNSIWNCD